MKKTALILSTAFVFLAAPMNTASAQDQTQDAEMSEALAPRLHLMLRAPACRSA